MKRNGILIFGGIFIVLMLQLVPQAAAEVMIEANIDRSRLAVGEQLVYDIIVSNAQGKIEAPKITSVEGFTAYSQGHSQEISIINGVSSSRSIYSYVLVANTPGMRTIGPFEISIEGKSFSVAPIQVDVTAQAAAGSAAAYPAAQGPVSAPQPRALPTGNVSDQDIFCKAWLDKDEVYVNEPAMLTYTLYTRLSATYKGFEKEPVTTGFWIEDFPPGKTIDRTEQVINGSRYVVADVRKIALFPTQAGVSTVDPGTLAATVDITSEEQFNSFFSYNIFGSRRMALPSTMVTQTVPKLIPTVPVAITAKVLPEQGKPADFNGAVGSYEIDSSIDKKEIEAGNPLTFRVRIRGQGNLNMVVPPVLTKSDEFRFYDSASSANISKERNIVEGEKITETVIVPKKAGTFVLPVLSFSFFDPSQKTYKTIKTSSVTLKVLPSTETEPSPGAGGQGLAPEPVDKQPVSTLARDIRYIKTVNPPEAAAGAPLYRQPRYWFFNLLLLAALAAVALVSRRRWQGFGDLKSFRWVGPAAHARRRLANALLMAQKQKGDEFFREIARAVNHYFSQKLSVSPQAVSKRLKSRKPKG
ncbi:MAG: BatD family protein [Candidatus Omnitrophota bacterium]